MNLRRRVALTLLAVLFALALPASASAAVYEVNTTADEADKTPGAPCETSAAGICSLRAAIEVANSTTGVPDEIKFSVIFSGEDTDIIGLLSPLPTIVDQLKIHGGICDTDAGVKGPCASAIRAGGALLVVEDDDVEIQGLGLLGAGTAINVTNASERFVAKGNWIGFNLAGIPGVGAVNGIGIFLDPGSDDATIGGLTAADRNVIGGNSVTGLDLEGASGATIQGNYFGVTPKGDEAAPNPKNIEITDTVAFQATDNEIGVVIPSGSLSAPCDAGCNVISGSSIGIDLQGNGGNEEPATGPTRIRGNHIGLNAAGSDVIANPQYGIFSHEAEAVTIGGEENGEGNYFAGGANAVYHQDGKGFAALGNIFGAGPTGSSLTPPTLGVFVYCLNLGTLGVETVAVSGNVFRMSGGIGIEQVFGSAEIEENFIEGAQFGIFTRGDPPGAGNLIKDNVIGESLTNGILIESDFNIVLHNAIYDSGAAGIRIQDPTAFDLVITTGNLIGGTSAAEENTIRESGGDAVEIVDVSGNTEEDSYNAVSRNKGDDNAGLFIDLVGNANAGILPPAFASLQSSASGGGAEPNATIRVFRKETAAAGEIESLLGEVEADGSGEWKVTYPATIPVGTNVAATQTSVLGGTSELSIVTASADPGAGGESGGGSGGSGGTGGGPTSVSDTTAPTTKITKAPKAKTTGTTAKFKFKSNEAGSRFECKLDRGKFKKCKSPKTYKKLKPGRHVFKVRAIDQAGNVGKPAKRKFTVLAS